MTQALYIYVPEFVFSKLNQQIKALDLITVL